MLLLALVVMADGFFGPQVTPLNLAGVLPWIHWRALSIVALLAVGNLFCMACPFMFVRDIGRRVLPAGWRWPRWLRTKWLPTMLLLVYLWAYEAFNLWDRPWLTAWIIAAYFLAALMVDGFFRGASFCKYVCPIGQFHFVTSLISPREIRVRSAEVCKSCRTHDCIRGNEQARGCELYLFQPKKAGNLDCTFCMDCVKACPHENVGLLPVAPASTLAIDPYRSSIGRLSKRTDLAALALLIIFGAFVNAAGMVEPVMAWEHSWHARLGVHMMPIIVAAFVCLGAVLVPAIAVGLCACLNRLAGSGFRIADAARRFVFTLVPVGVAMWAAHLLYHFATGWSAPWPAVQRIIRRHGYHACHAFRPRLADASADHSPRCRPASHFVCWMARSETILRAGANSDCTADTLGGAGLHTLWNRHLDSVPADADAWHAVLKRAIRNIGTVCAGTVLASTLVFADGGTMLFRKRADPFVVTAFGEPVPVRVGATDLSVMVQNADDRTSVLDATVNIRAKKSSTGSVVEIMAPATHARATNKLLYAAHVTLPSAGEWQLIVDIKRGSAAASASTDLNVLAQEAPAETYWPYFAIVPLLALAFALNRWLRRKWQRSPQARP